MLQRFHSLVRKVFAIVCLETSVLVAACMPGRASESVGVRMTSLDKRADYLFARGEVFGLATNRASIVDTFVTTNLLSEWNWIDANRLGAGTNATAVLIVPHVLEMTNMPNQIFVKILPTNAVEYVGSGKKLPVLSLSQDRKVYVREILSSIIPQNPSVSKSISYGCSAQAIRGEYFGQVRGGDSSCPNFMLCGTTPVLLGCHLTASSAPSIILTQPHIQRMMNELSDQTGKPRCDLQYLDLTPFQRIGTAE